jgi:hypothetical protein
MRVMCVLTACLVGCWHQLPAAAPSDNVAADRRAGSEKTCQTGCPLALTMRQLPADSVISLEFRLMNVSRDHILWVSNRPRVGNAKAERRSTEIELHLMDHNAREVSQRCLELRSSAGVPAYTALSPGQVTMTTYTMRPGCYLLDPGEILNAVATYASPLDTPDNPPGTMVFDETVSTGPWQQIFVPRQWNARPR